MCCDPILELFNLVAKYVFISINDISSILARFVIINYYLWWQVHRNITIFGCTFIGLSTLHHAFGIQVIQINSILRIVCGFDSVNMLRDRYAYEYS